MLITIRKNDDFAENRSLFIFSQPISLIQSAFDLLFGISTYTLTTHNTHLLVFIPKRTTTFLHVQQNTTQSFVTERVILRL